MKWYLVVVHMKEVTLSKDDKIEGNSRILYRSNSQRLQRWKGTYDIDYDEGEDLDVDDKLIKYLE